MSDLIAAEQKLLNTLAPSFRGYQLMLVGNQRPLDWIPKNRLHNFSVGPKFGGIISDYENLPIRNNSIDIAVIPYELEDTKNPELVLAELHRCLISNGKLFILTHYKLHPFNWLKKASSILELKNLLAKTNFEYQKINWLYYGSAVMIEAQKNTIGLTPIRPQWEKKSVLANLDNKEWQPTPTTREIHD